MKLQSTPMCRSALVAAACLLPLAALGGEPYRAGHSPHAGYPSHGHHGYGPEYGPYIGAAISRNRLEVDLAGGLTEIDADDTGYKVFLGHAFSEYVRIELGFVDFGELQELIDLGPLGIQDVSVEADGPTLGLELGVPLGEYLSVHARGGVVFWDAEGTVNGFGIEDEGEDAFYGVGVRYRLSPNLSVVGAWERFELDDVDVDVASLGLSFRF